jgi:two-component sensor histidine kinase
MTDSYEKVKFIVTRNVFIFTCFAMSILVLMNLFIDSNNLITAILAVFFSTSVLVYLVKSKSYLIPAIMAIILGYSINLYNLFQASIFESFIDIFWLINLSIFAYFTLGKLIGHIYLTINISTIFIISSLAKLNYIELVPTTTTQDISMFIEFGTNLLICTVFFGYLITEFIKQNNVARQDSVKSNLEFQKQYDEKSTMLKEIHHRVKNNLQVVTSLLRLQLYKIEDETAVVPFQESIDRISSMALIHDKMYKGDKVKAINIKNYINDLAENLIKNYANEKFINLTVHSSVKTIELNHIVPLSLILNELISNSLKHAFQNKNNGEIIVNISTNESTHLKLCYKDNGTWKSPKDPTSFGLELIDTFTEQLNGTYTLETLNGTYYCFQFKDIITFKNNLRSH